MYSLTYFISCSKGKELHPLIVVKGGGIWSTLRFPKEFILLFWWEPYYSSHEARGSYLLTTVYFWSFYKSWRSRWQIFQNSSGSWTRWWRRGMACNDGGGKVWSAVMFLAGNLSCIIKSSCQYVTEPWNHRMACAGKDLKDPPTSLPWAGLPTK